MKTQAKEINVDNLYIQNIQTALVNNPCKLSMQTILINKKNWRPPQQQEAENIRHIITSTILYFQPSKIQTNKPTP